MLLPFMIKLIGILKTYKLKLLKLLKGFLYITIAFWNSCLVYSSTFTSTPVSLPTWNVYQMGCWYFDVWITKQLFRIGSYVSSCCMRCGHVLFRGFLVFSFVGVLCRSTLCFLACAKVVVLVCNWCHSWWKNSNVRASGSALPRKLSGHPWNIRTPENSQRVRALIEQSPRRSARNTLLPWEFLIKLWAEFFVEI
jgi:hypothetical protein